MQANEQCLPLIRLTNEEGALSFLSLELQAREVPLGKGDVVEIEVGIGGSDFVVKPGLDKSGKFYLTLYAPIRCHYRVSVNGVQVSE